MKVTKTQLQNLVKALVLEERKRLTEGQDFTARRIIQQAAQRVSFEFEDEIKNALGLNPDLMPDEVQRRYHEVAEAMKSGIVKSVMGAVDILSQFPKPPSETGGGKGL